MADEPAPEHPGDVDQGLVDQGLERLVFFSDAVIAIALTLLAFDLPLPSGSSNAAIWRSFAHLLGDQYLTFLISFVVVGAFWAGHHDFFRHVSGMDGRLLRLNMLYLLGIVIVPFAGRMLGSEGKFQAPTVFYASIVTLIGGIRLLMLWYVRRHGLIRTDIPPGWTAAAVRMLVVLAAVFALSIPIAFVDTSKAKYSWMTVALLGPAIARLARRRREAVPAQ